MNKIITVKLKGVEEPRKYEGNVSPSIAPPFYAIVTTHGQIQQLKNASLIPLDNIESIEIQEIIGESSSGLVTS